MIKNSSIWYQQKDNRMGNSVQFLWLTDNCSLTCSRTILGWFRWRFMALTWHALLDNIMWKMGCDPEGVSSFRSKLSQHGWSTLTYVADAACSWKKAWTAENGVCHCSLKFRSVLHDTECPKQLSGLITSAHPVTCLTVSPSSKCLGILHFPPHTASLTSRLIDDVSRVS